MQAKQLLTTIIRTSGFYLLYLVLYQFVLRITGVHEEYLRYQDDFWDNYWCLLTVLVLLYVVFIKGAERVAALLKPGTGIIAIDFRNTVFCLRVCLLAFGIFRLSEILFLRLGLIIGRDAGLYSCSLLTQLLFATLFIVSNKSLSVFIARRIVTLDQTRNPLFNKLLYIAGIVILFVQSNIYFVRGFDNNAFVAYFLGPLVMAVMIGLVILHSNTSLLQADFFEAKPAVPEYALPLYAASFIVVLDSLFDIGAWTSGYIAVHKWNPDILLRSFLFLLSGVVLFFGTRLLARWFSKLSTAKFIVISVSVLYVYVVLHNIFLRYGKLNEDFIGHSVSTVIIIVLSLILGHFLNKKQITIAEEVHAEADLLRFAGVLFCCIVFLFNFSRVIRFSVEGDSSVNKIFYGILIFLITVIIVAGFHFWFVRIQRGMSLDLRGLIRLGLLFSGYPD